jgi:hypothetical protein
VLELDDEVERVPQYAEQRPAELKLVNNMSCENSKNWSSTTTLSEKSKESTAKFPGSGGLVEHDAVGDVKDHAKAAPAGEPFALDPKSEVDRVKDSAQRFPVELGVDLVPTYRIAIVDIGSQNGAAAPQTRARFSVDDKLSNGLGSRQSKALGRHDHETCDHRVAEEQRPRGSHAQCRQTREDSIMRFKAANFSVLVDCGVDVELFGGVAVFHGVEASQLVPPEQIEWVHKIDGDDQGCEGTITTRLSFQFSFMETDRS